MTREAMRDAPLRRIVRQGLKVVRREDAVTLVDQVRERESERPRALLNNGNRRYNPILSMKKDSNTAILYRL